MQLQREGNPTVFEVVELAVCIKRRVVRKYSTHHMNPLLLTLLKHSLIITLTHSSNISLNTKYNVV